MELYNYLMSIDTNLLVALGTLLIFVWST